MGIVIWVFARTLENALGRDWVWRFEKKRFLLRLSEVVGFIKGDREFRRTAMTSTVFLFLFANGVLIPDVGFGSFER